MENNNQALIPHHQLQQQQQALPANPAVQMEWFGEFAQPNLYQGDYLNVQQQVGHYQIVYQQFGEHQNAQQFGEHQNAQQFGGHQNAQQFGEHQNAQQFGGHQNAQQFGGHQNAQQFGGHQNAQQFGGHQNAQQFGGPQNAQQFGGHQNAQQFGEHQNAQQQFHQPAHWDRPQLYQNCFNAGQFPGQNNHHLRVLRGAANLWGILEDDHKQWITELTGLTLDQLKLNIAHNFLAQHPFIVECNGRECGHRYGSLIFTKCLALLPAVSAAYANKCLDIDMELFHKITRLNEKMIKQYVNAKIRLQKAFDMILAHCVSSADKLPYFHMNELLEAQNARSNTINMHSRMYAGNFEAIIVEIETAADPPLPINYKKFRQFGGNSWNNMGKNNIGHKHCLPNELLAELVAFVPRPHHRIRRAQFLLVSSNISSLMQRRLQRWKWEMEEVSKLHLLYMDGKRQLYAEADAIQALPLPARILLGASIIYKYHDAQWTSRKGEGIEQFLQRSSIREIIQTMQALLPSHFEQYENNNQGNGQPIIKYLLALRDCTKWEWRIVRAMNGRGRSIPGLLYFSYR